MTQTANDAAVTAQSFESAGERTGAVTPGDCIGRYTIKALLGAGGMGQVYAASDPELGRTVALKIIHTERTSPQARLRLVREAQALARLHHPNVVAVHDIGTGEPMFIAMELVGGITLEAWLREAARDWREVVRVMADAGRGLAAAHAAGVIHRDFKPANTLVGDRVVVVDFGIARVGDEVDSDDRPPQSTLSVDLTETGAMVGTFAYMAPEQKHGMRVTEAADQYAFCLSLWEALYGARPMAERRRPGSTTVPARVHAIVERGLATDAADRWPDMRSLVAALDRTIARRAKVTGVLAAALALVAIGSVVGWRVMHDRSERRIAAEQLGREAEQIRGHMRAARLLPAHDIAVERKQLKLEMTAIEHKMAELGDVATGPGEFALGAALFSSDRVRATRDAARKHLQAAWDAGERAPELAFELGYALESEYDVQIEMMPPLAGAEREKHVQELQHTLRDPAIGYLRQATGVDTTGEYIEALIAQSEGRYADAVTLGEAALRAQPTLYEAGLLVANALSHAQQVAVQNGDVASARDAEQRMLAMFDRIVDVGRSDEFVYKIYAKALSSVAGREARNSKDVAAMLDRVEDMTSRGALVDSDVIWPDVMHARTLDLYAVNDSHFQRDGHAHLQGAVTAAERAVATNPKNLEAQLALGDAYGYLVDGWETPHGIDPRPSLEKSIAGYKAAIAIAPDATVSENLGQTYSSLAHWQWGHGLDPQPAIDEMVKLTDDAFRMAPGDAPEAPANVCNLLGDQARMLIENGRDPAAVIARARPYCDSALKQTPGEEPAHRYAANLDVIEGEAMVLAGTDPRAAWQRADGELKKALELAPKRVEVHTSLAMLRADRAAYERAPTWPIAIAEARTAIEIDHENVDASCVFMEVAVRAGDSRLLDDAAKVATSMIALDPDDVRVRILAGEIALARGNQADALAAATKALELDPHHARAMSLRRAAGGDRDAKSETLAFGAPGAPRGAPVSAPSPR
ncbi:MAG: protein kinase [Kofleriaceae bacterium]